MERNGALHVLRLGANPLTGKDRYSITYTPYDKHGGALPSREAGSPSELQAFLCEIKCDRGMIDGVLSEIQSTGRASIPNVILSDDQLRGYGLQEMGVLQSILSYLSS